VNAFFSLNRVFNLCLVFGVGADRRVLPRVTFSVRLSNEMLNKCVFTRAVDASCVCRGRRMLRKIRWMFGSAGQGGNATWRCGSTIPDGGSWESALWFHRWPSWTVPALTAAECYLSYNHRDGEYPASGPPSPHSTAHRDVTLDTNDTKTFG
jgi:hypothetical protein